MEVNVVIAQETFLAEVSDLVQTELTKYLSDDCPNRNGNVRISAWPG